MADVFGWPVVDIYVDSTPPDPPQPKVSATGVGSVSFSWDPVEDRGDGAGPDYWASGMDHYSSWLTVDGGAAQQYADTPAPRTIRASGLAPGQSACVHVRAFDRLGNGTAEQRACGKPLAAPPLPPPPPAGEVGANPYPAGLAGLESWFWISPAPQRQVTTMAQGGVSYEITSQPAVVRWDFDDGPPAILTGPESAGQAYPAKSSARHVYERQRQEGYAVGATISWQRSWRALVNGVWYGPYDLDSVEVAQRPLRYPMRQAQSELEPPS